MSELHVVIGVTGPLGQNIVRQLLEAGIGVRGINRSGRDGSGSVPTGVELVGGDIRDPSAARNLCKGASVVYQCASAPYTAKDGSRIRWTSEVDFLPAIVDGAIVGAAAAGARLVYADNFYMYGAVDTPFHEELPSAPSGPKSECRAAVAERLLAAHGRGEIAASIGCASDFFGPGVLNSTTGDLLFEAVIKGEPAQIIGAPDVLHSYSFIEDVASGLIELGRHERAMGEIWFLPNDNAITPRRFFELAYEVAAETTGYPMPAITVAPSNIEEELGYDETSFTMDRPFIVDHGKFDRAFGVQPTPIREALRRTIEWFTSRRDESEV